MREVERLEVVEVLLDLGTFGDLEAHISEDLGELGLHARERVRLGDGGLPRGQRDVDRLGGEASRQLGLFEGLLARFEGSLDRLLGAVRDLARLGLLLIGQLADDAHQRLHLPLATEVAVFDLEGIFERGDLLELGDRLLLQGEEIGLQLGDIHELGSVL